MNARYLMAILVILVAMAMAFTSRSTLTPQRGADHVVYGPTLEGGAFVGQEIAIGDFDGDGFDDFVSAIGWDDPAPGGAVLQGFTTSFACSENPVILKDRWGTFLAAKGADTLRVCDFTGDFGALHRAEWFGLGWDSLAAGDCDECYEDLLSDSLATALCDSCRARDIKGENQGAVYALKGGDWSTKPHDTDLNLTVGTAGGADHLIYGAVPLGNIYNGLAAENMDLPPDPYDELALGAPGVGAGVAYVIRGADSWPSVIDLGDSGDVGDHVAHYLIGRDAGDGFGEGIAMGDLDGDGKADIVVAARRAAGPDADPRTNGGEIYIFYAASLPDTVDLSGLTDNALAASEHVSVVYGPAEDSYIGVTHLYSCHPVHPGGPLVSHQGHYNPVGLAIGDWDGDGRNDLAIGGGQAGGTTNGLNPGDGAVYVIFGRAPGASNKLQPGRIVDLANAPSPTSVEAPDVRITGKYLSALGAGVAFVDADGQGGPGTQGAQADLIIGAPEAGEERGEVYLIFGDSRANLTDGGMNDRDMANASHYDVIILGESEPNESCGTYGYGDQLGGHFSGNLDFDQDGKNDVGISGQEENYVFFVRSRSDWPDSLDLDTVHETHPEVRVVDFVGTRPASSSTIRFLDLDNDRGHDLVFGGYDIENRSDAPHAGQMWVWKGSDVWKSGTLTETSTTWSGNIFVDGDLIVPEGKTLTIAAGTDVWIWPTDVQKNMLGVDTTRVEIHVYGELHVQGTLLNHVNFKAWGVDESTPNLDNLWYGIFIRDSDSTSTISNCVIQNATRAIQVRAPATITSVNISDCRLRGVSVAGEQANVVMTSVFVDGSEIAFRAADGATATMTNCEAEGSSLYGVRIASGADVTVSGGSILANDIGAYVDCDSLCPTSAVFDGVAFSEACSVAVYVEGNVSGSIENCTVAAITDGIVVDHVGTGFSITDNLIVIDENGITCDGGGPAITGNTIEFCGTGIYCDNEAAPVVRGNRIQQNVVGVGAVNDANPDLGQACSASCDTTGGCASEGGNSFKSNSSHHIVNLSPSITVMAECDYFKKNTAAYFSGSIDRTPSRSSDPLPVSPFAGRPLPDRYALGHNFPNPFNPSTTVKYQIPPPGGDIAIRIYDVAGRLVRTLVSTRQRAGYYEVHWDGVTDRGAPVASGIYFLQMKAPGFVESRKLVLLK